ncbi:unknown protein [Microcystis aeruginosa NIES-843]|uniref:Uncharacterized protein n=1 Tax=Microcystis aeruginosa (strain NIES-843 / IAM M-2473) TaxID=449447 RepID=B0JM29_MICAN|nr:unknown protein [Microcystis aeruginosa NIES-843]
MVIIARSGASSPVSSGVNFCASTREMFRELLLVFTLRTKHKPLTYPRKLGFNIYLKCRFEGTLGFTDEMKNRPV